MTGRRQLHGAKGRLAETGRVGVNRLLARLRHLFAWAVAEGYGTATPLQAERCHCRSGLRTRRKVPAHAAPADGRNEAATGIAGRARKNGCSTHADPHLRAVIVAALSTGCRLGELLSLSGSKFSATRKATRAGSSCRPHRRRLNKAPRDSDRASAPGGARHAARRARRQTVGAQRACLRQ